MADPQKKGIKVTEYVKSNKLGRSGLYDRVTRYTPLPESSGEMEKIATLNAWNRFKQNGDLYRYGGIQGHYQMRPGDENQGLGDEYVSMHSNKDLAKLYGSTMGSMYGVKLNAPGFNTPKVLFDPNRMADGISRLIFYDLMNPETKAGYTDEDYEWDNEVKPWRDQSYHRNLANRFGANTQEPEYGATGNSTIVPFDPTLHNILISPKNWKKLSYKLGGSIKKRF